MTGSWVNSEALASSDIFEAVHAGLTVSLIMTPRDKWMTCSPDEQVSVVMSRNRDHYDFVPVQESVEAGKHISGLFHAAPFRDGPAPDESIREYVIPLAEDFLIGADASILDFITDADTRPCRLVLAGARIGGLVSLSDLQKLPVRAALFALTTGFEITMAEAIREQYRTYEEWIGFLSNARRDRLLELVEKSRANDAFVDRLLFAEFADKKTIVKKGINIGLSKAKVEDKLSQVESLRNKVAHANNYASTPEEARETCQVVRELLSLRRLISDAVA